MASALHFISLSSRRPPADLDLCLCPSHRAPGCSVVGQCVFVRRTFSRESRAFSGLTFLPLRALMSSLLITGSLSCSSHDHIRPESTRGSLSIHSLSHAPSLEFSSICAWSKDHCYNELTGTRRQENYSLHNLNVVLWLCLLHSP